MKYILKYSFVLVCFVYTFYSNGSNRVKRLINGYPAEPGQFPYQVSLRDEFGKHICGGSIIDTRFILTAGHCVENLHPRNVFIVAGTNLLNPFTKFYQVEKIALHGDYAEIINDIAVIKTKEEMEYSELVQPISLELEDVPQNSLVLLSGWGVENSYDEDPPNELNFIETTTISLLNCKQLFPTSDIDERNICAFNAEGKRPCYGDSGGPLTFNGKLIAVVSWGSIKCMSSYPAVFTKVSYFVDWIETVMIAMK